MKLPARPVSLYVARVVDDHEATALKAVRHVYAPVEEGIEDDDDVGLVYEVAFPYACVVYAAEGSDGGTASLGAVHRNSLRVFALEVYCRCQDLYGSHSALPAPAVETNLYQR